MTDSAALRAIGVYIMKGEVWVGDVDLMEVTEQDPWKRLLYSGRCACCAPSAVLRSRTSYTEAAVAVF